MEHYKIVKKTYTGIDHHGNITEKSKYKAYHKILGFIWERMTAYSMLSDGCTAFASDSVAFNTEEDAERFIRVFHENRFKINNYTIETVKKLDLK
jgi:hypothetical protein